MGGATLHLSGREKNVEATKTVSSFVSCRPFLTNSVNLGGEEFQKKKLHCLYKLTMKRGCNSIYVLQSPSPLHKGSHSKSDIQSETGFLTCKGLT